MPKSSATSESEALRRIDRARATVSYWITAAAVVEGALLIAFVILADFSNRTHLLLLIACALIYMTLALAMLALAAFTRWWALRIIAAMEALASLSERSSGPHAPVSNPNP